MKLLGWLAFAYVQVQDLIDDAVEKGAKVEMGGEAVGDTLCYKPTILTGVTSEMDISNTEIFGPVAAIQRFVSLQVTFAVTCYHSFRVKKRMS